MAAMEVLLNPVRLPLNSASTRVGLGLRRLHLDSSVVRPQGVQCGVRAARQMVATMAMAEGVVEKEERLLRPKPAESARIETLSEDGWSLGTEVRYAVDMEGSPALRLESDATHFQRLLKDSRCSLHVQGSWSIQVLVSSSLKINARVVEGYTMGDDMWNTSCLETGLQFGDSFRMFTADTCYPEATFCRGVESRFTMICLFMHWKAITRKSFKQLHLCKAAHAPSDDTEEANHILSDFGQLDSEVDQEAIQVTAGEDFENANASAYTRRMNECMRKKDYSAGLKQLMDMVDAGIEPGYMTWICVLQACGQCAYRVDLLRLLAGLRDAGCPLPLRLILEREAAIPELENWLKNLQATAADAGQGMVNVLVDILWAFRLRATAGHVYDLAVCLDIYPRNFARVEEQNWEADFRNLSPGAALVALNHWFIKMQVASLEGFPEPQKEVLMITGTQGYQNGMSLNKTLRAHLWEMGSPFFMRPPREGALITKGHALRLWLKDSPRCFSLDLEDSVILPRRNSMSFFKGAWMSSDAVPVMTQIHSSIGEVWPRKFSKLAHMTETRRIEALAARIENEKRRRLEARNKPAKKKATINKRHKNK